MLEVIRNGEDPGSHDLSTNAVVGEFAPVGIAAKAKAKKVYTPRGSSYTTFEDVLLCRAWLDTSMDAICGTEKKGTKLWEKIHAPLLMTHKYRGSQQSSREVKHNLLIRHKGSQRIFVRLNR